MRHNSPPSPTALPHPVEAVHCLLCRTRFPNCEHWKRLIVRKRLTKQIVTPFANERSSFIAAAPCCDTLFCHPVVPPCCATLLCNMAAESRLGASYMLLHALLGWDIGREGATLPLRMVFARSYAFFSQFASWDLDVLLLRMKIIIRLSFLRGSGMYVSHTRLFQT